MASIKTSLTVDLMVKILFHIYMFHPIFQEHAETSKHHRHTMEAVIPDQGQENTYGDARQPSLSWEAWRARRTHGARLSCRTHGTRSALFARLARPSRFSWDARCTGRTRVSGGARFAGGTHGTNHARRPRWSLVPCFTLREGRWVRS